jgi:hypothetical protein
MNRTIASRGGTDRELVPLPETLIAYSAKDGEVAEAGSAY